MEPILPSPPQAAEEQPAQQETRLEAPAQPISIDQIANSSGPSLSFASDHGWEKRPYSPPKTEVESHPLPLHPSSQGDEISISLEPAPEVPREFDRETRPAVEEQQELAQEVNRNAPDTMADTTIKEGDSVFYAWGGDKKGGTVAEVATEGSVAMETARGNTVTKEAEPNDPAVRLERAGHDVVKNASELQKEEVGETHNEGGVQKTVTEQENGEPNTGEKSAAEPKENSEANTGEKRAAEPEENGEEPKKKKGRPAKNGAAGPKKEHKKRPPKKAATETGEPRRSGRNAAKSS